MRIPGYVLASAGSKMAKYIQDTEVWLMCFSEAQHLRILGQIKGRALGLANSDSCSEIRYLRRVLQMEC